MIERPMPSDILKYKSKAILGFSAREAICGSISIGIIAYFALSVFTDIPDASVRAFVSMLPALPTLLIGFMPIYGVPFEKIIVPLIWDNVICPVKRLKEVHHPEMEQYEKKRYWLKPKDKVKCKKSRQIKAIR